MRDDDRRALPTAQQLFEPCDAVEIEVIGRFVEQQQVGLIDKRARQRDALSHAARKANHRRVGGQAQAFQRGAHARWTLPVFEIVRDTMHDVEHRKRIVQRGLLFDRGHAQSGHARDLAVIGLAAAIEQAQQ